MPTPFLCMYCSNSMLVNIWQFSDTTCCSDILNSAKILDQHGIVTDAIMQDIRYAFIHLKCVSVNIKKN